MKPHEAEDENSAERGPGNVSLQNLFEHDVVVQATEDSFLYILEL